MELSALVLSVLFTILSVRATADQRGFSIPIIHINSPLHPLYNSNITLFDELTRWSTNDFNERAPVRHTSVYLMEIYIGTPPRKKYVCFDSGSNLLWVQCDPCIDCPSVFDTPYRPSESRSYHPLSCNSTFCHKDNEASCVDGRCIFRARYLDGDSLRGELGSDMFSFSHSENFFHSVTNITFGCAHIDQINHDDGSSGS
uniref:Peptidase A1 domain-containing protein n=1 Tax=Ananas comosus var. bracteatus TaxID=296719 RepID=A0A6V7QPM3_ANACO|nr:unnamed protein product [Ananas comosus var. bracteatus]